MGFPIIHLTAIISLSSGAVLNIAIGDYYSSEHGLLREMLEGLSEGDIYMREIKKGQNIIVTTLLDARNI